MSKFTNLFRIAYHGSAFHGSQIQPDVMTVEGVVKKILKNLGSSNPLFASRTDRGVNAKCNIITTVSNRRCKEYVGEFIDSKRHGQGTKTNADGSVMKGIWEEGGLVESN